MLTQDQLTAIELRLRDRMLAQLGMRWKKAGAYIPTGSAKVHCAHELSDADQSDFDMYALAYQDAITDFLDMLDKGPSKPERPYALMLAENSIFQDGTLPAKAARPKVRDRHTRPVKGQSSEARARAEALFRKGGGDG